MTRWNEAKIRDDDTWDQVRRAWEAGETGQTCARRFDVGLANLWRRRAAEGWERRRKPDPVPEPAEGWDRSTRRKQRDFRQARLEARTVAEKLCEAMAGGPLEGVPLWDVGYVLRWRAGRLGAETAARDRDWARRYGWTDRFWDSRGALRPIEALDMITLQANLAAWREAQGVPDHVPVELEP